MKKIPYVKMVGAGNDFLVLEKLPAGVEASQLAKVMCARQSGVGADGLLIFDKSSTTDYKMRIINSDGSEAEMCGNGARCMAAYIVQHMLPQKKLFGMETLAGTILAEADGEMARVRLSDPKDYKTDIPLSILGKTMPVSYIDTGVPHAIVFVAGLHDVDVNRLGPLIRNHKKFQPRGTNVDFVELIKTGTVEVRTYERGVEAETLACGTGAVASALVAYMKAHPDIKERKDAVMNVVTASTETLEVTFDLLDGTKITNVWLKGSARFVGQGEYFFKD